MTTFQGTCAFHDVYIHVLFFKNSDNLKSHIKVFFEGVAPYRIDLVLLSVLFKVRSAGWQKNCEDRTRAVRTCQPVKRVCVSELIICVFRCSSTAWASDRTASLFLPSFCMASSLQSSLLISLVYPLCFLSWQCCCWHQSACVSIHVCLCSCMHLSLCVCLHLCRSAWITVL